MAFNRYADTRYDAQNTRTAIREIPGGIIRPANALLFVVVNCLLFVAATWFINPLCFYLSPVALLVVLGYSYTKRFTSLCHFVLGIGLGLAPVGAFLAVSSQFEWLPVLFGFAVLFWVSGFDIIYALQDEEFDKTQGLNSIPARLGKKKALYLSNALHFISAMFIIGTACRRFQRLQISFFLQSFTSPYTCGSSSALCFAQTLSIACERGSW